MPAYKDKRRGNRWRYAKMVALPDGSRKRITGTPQVNTKRAAETAERAHIERVLAGKPSATPTIKEYSETFMSCYVANNNKLSEQAHKESMLRCRVLPLLGDKRLDQVTLADVEIFKRQLLDGGHGGRKLAPKSVNNTLILLKRVFSYARKNKVVSETPEIVLLKHKLPEVDFLSDAELDRLVNACEPVALIGVLLGADAGLRLGEIRGVMQQDIARGVLTVERSIFKNHVGTPKSGKSRRIPLTKRLTDSLREGKTGFVLSGDRHLSNTEMRTLLTRARKRAGLRPFGWHTLRHTFCSHLAMRGVPTKAIQELAGHSSVLITQRYMHLSENEKVDAIDMLGR